VEKTNIVEQISPEELRQRLSEGRAPTLVDVREPWEYALASLPGSVLVPLGELPVRLGEFDPSEELVVYCHHGVRSVHAAFLLARSGYRRVLNLQGGIDSYSDVDPAIPRYG
jgi:rhodanese-related sulfurtransferase